MLPKLDSPEEAVARVHPMTKKISTIINVIENIYFSRLTKIALMSKVNGLLHTLK